MHSSTAEEGSDSWHSWRSHLMQIWFRDFSQMGVSIRGSSDSRGGWSHSGSLFLPNESVTWCWSGDFSGELISSRIMISWYFLGIVSGQWGIFEMMRRSIIIVIRHRGISMTFGSSISRVCHGLYVRFLRWLFVFLHMCTRDILLGLIRLLPILAMSRSGFGTLQAMRVRSSIHRRIQVALLHDSVIARNEAIQKIWK